MELPLEQPPGPPTAREKLIRAVRKSRNARFEEQLAFEIRAHGLPQPHEQYRWATEVLSETGRPRQFRADFAWPAPEYRLLLQVHGGLWMRSGGGHSHPMHLEKDMEQHRIAAMLRWFVMPVTTDEVKKGQAIQHLERFFASRGWAR